MGTAKSSVSVEGLPNRPNKRLAQRYSESEEEENSDDEAAGEKARRKKIKRENCID